MATADEIVIIIMFSVSLIAFAVLMAVLVIQWRTFAAGGDKWRQWFLENPEKAPVHANRWIPLMNRQQILDAAELLDNANPSTS